MSRRINGEEALSQDHEKNPSDRLQRGSPVHFCQESPVERGAESDTLKCSFEKLFLKCIDFILCVWGNCGFWRVGRGRWMVTFGALSTSDNL